MQDIFKGWSEEIHDILRVTKEDEIGIRDLYDRPPTVLRNWNDDSGRVTLMGPPCLCSRKKLAEFDSGEKSEESL